MKLLIKKLLLCIALSCIISLFFAKPISIYIFVGLLTLLTVPNIVSYKHIGNKIKFLLIILIIISSVSIIGAIDALEKELYTYMLISTISILSSILIKYMKSKYYN